MDRDLLLQCGVKTCAEVSGAVPDPQQSARLARLRYVNDGALPGIRRAGTRAAPRYTAPNGRQLRDRATLQRIASLVIPPAWTDVWICPHPDGHLQATGRDARGRKQYRYHPRWRDLRDEVKYGRLLAFAAALPRIRRRVDADLAAPRLSREKVLALVVQLLERTLIRVGNEEYARDNGSIGLTTMKDGHARVAGETVTFQFKGKSGIRHAVDVRDRRLARIVKACRDLPGYELFQYQDANGKRRSIGSGDVNMHLRAITGDDFTAKDFRTWAGTVMAAVELARQPEFRSAAHARRNVAAAIEVVARRLGNTKAVARKCYIHPAVIDAYLEGEVIGAERARVARAGGLNAEERAAVRLLESRMRKARTRKAA